MEVYIDASCDILYSSYYIKGLRDIYGRKNLKFSKKFFKNFQHNNHFLAIVLKNKDYFKKIIIDFTDSSDIDQNALEWSDIYAKINIDDTYNFNSNKIISIGPGFGIKIFSNWLTIYYAIKNLLKSYTYIPDKKRFLSDYKAQLARPTLEEFYPENYKHNYIYFTSSLWKKEQETNKYRTNFINACIKNKNIEFEGGFFPRTKNDIKGYEKITLASKDNMKKYLTNIKKSMICFNTPSVKGCHGWKLAEFLCLRKAIISTPIIRKLPKPLYNGKHFLITNGSEKDISAKIDKLISNTELMEEISANARAYFEKYLTPANVIRQIIK
jgi:glycosyltransferase involved in cell wall biosynthesis